MSLRTQLAQIPEGITPDEHIRQVGLLAPTYSHHIVPLPSLHPLSEYTCLMHALGFAGQQDYKAVATMPPGSVFAGRRFAEWLWRGGKLHVVTFTDAVPGDLVWYFESDDSFQHVGLLRDGGRVESKWGDVGLYEHSLWEVPENYGNQLRASKPLSLEDAINSFFDFAEENGIEFQTLDPETSRSTSCAKNGAGQMLRDAAITAPIAQTLDKSSA
jgi:hypothetical protein